jgi:DNA mismatch repair protein MutS
MMVQYREIKNRHRDAILFFRLGDFYEMFDADAKEASQLLEIALTQRNGVPMCGVPHHSARSYIARLLKAGRRVAVCEQTALPSGGKGIARREVMEVVTPGTVLDEELLDGGNNNFLVAVGCAPVRHGGRTGAERGVAVAALDVSTGEFRATAFPLADAAARVADELARLTPRELLVQESLLDDSPPVARAIHQHVPRSTVVQRYPDWQFDVAAGGETLCELFKVTNLKAFGLSADAPELAPAGLLVNFARQTARHGLAHLEGINTYGRDSFVTLDEAAQRSLELVRNLEDGSRERTLLAVLDHTRTPMGARLLRRAILEPLRDPAAISKRLDAVEALFRRQHLLAAVRERLRRVSDLERLAGRVAMSRAHPRDLRAIADSVRAAAAVAEIIAESGGDSASAGDGGSDVAALAGPLAGAARAVDRVAALIEEAVVNEPPLSINDGGILRSGYDAGLDRVRAVAEDAESLLRAYLEEERERSGIATLRLRHNRVLGHYLEVTRAQAARVPSHFVRRQSLVGGERFTTDRLAQLDGEISAAGDQIRELERDRFLALREQVAGHVPAILALARVLAGVDLAHSLALAATTGGYTRPELCEPGSGIHIREGRHPVVEAMLPSGAFVPNDLHLEPGGTRFILLTGPNMAGKSTYLRQTALIVLLAQVGSFVPAEEARIGAVDGIFCRVGASDNLARGESTFLVEMNETARILRAASEHSFIILDEIGRGTSTEDGRAIAWAVCEHLLDVVRAQTLFATHLRELTEIQHPHAANYSLQVEDEGREVVFLKRVEPGAADQSYGVHVAALAGVPGTVVTRARELLGELSGSVDGTPAAHGVPTAGGAGGDRDAAGQPDPAYRQGALFSPHELVGRAVAALDVDATTPLAALQLLARWQRELREPER